MTLPNDYWLQPKGVSNKFRDNFQRDTSCKYDEHKKEIIWKPFV